MLNDKILEYFTALNDLSWYEIHGDSSLLMLPFVALVGITACLGVILIVGLGITTLKLFKQEKYVQEVSTDIRVDYAVTGWFAKRPVITFILIVISVLLITGLIKFINHTGEIKSDLSDLKGEIITGVMEDYLEGYTGEILKSQDIFSATEIEKDTLIKTSFKIDGVQHNNKFVYITYSPNYETDTLIPFEASNYPELIPTDEQREAPGRYGVIGDREKGFKLKGYSQNAVYIDDVDFIYNIKIND